MMNFQSNREKHAYMAGIIDGEGCISLNISDSEYKYYRLRVQVSSTSKEIITWICDNFGGTICFVKEREGNRKCQHRWTLYSNEDIEAFIIKIFPFLIIKKRQACEALNFINKLYHEKDEDFFERFRILNHRGKE